MMIDIHAHVLAFPLIKSRFNNQPLMNDEQLVALMDKEGIDKAVLLPLSNAETPYEVQSIGEIFYICQQHPGRFIPFCNIDPRLPKNPKTVTEKDFEFLLEQYLAIGCKGIGEMTARIPWNHSLMRELLKACNKFKLPLTFHTVTEDFDCYGVIDKIGLPLLEEALKEFSDIKFFGHSMAFWSEISGGIKDLEEKNGYSSSPIKSGGRIQKLMRQYSNIYGDLSADSGLNALKRDVKHAYEFLMNFRIGLCLVWILVLQTEFPRNMFNGLNRLFNKGA